MQAVDYVEFDVPRDVLASLELVSLSLRLVEGDALWWKWIAIGAHMAASSALVGYLTHTNGVGALAEKTTRELLDWYESPSPRFGFPSDRIAEFTILLSRAAKGYDGSGFGPRIEISNELLARLEKLNWIRSRFNHFRAEGWMIEQAYLLAPVDAAMAVVARVEAHGWSFRHASEQTQDRVRTLLIQIRGDLGRMGVPGSRA